jgi:hypothetical protein
MTRKVLVNLAIVQHFLGLKTKLLFLRDSLEHRRLIKRERQLLRTIGQLLKVEAALQIL